MSDPLPELSERLLRQGLSPARVRRYVRELRDHRDDLAEHLEAGGLSPAAARAEAQRRLGDAQALALPMLTHRGFRSRVSRFPALFYLGLPLSAQLGFALAGILALALLAGTPLRPLLADLGTLTALSWLGAPVLSGWALLAMSRRRRGGRFWPLLGGSAGVLLATALQLEVAMPGAAESGEIAVALAVPAPLPAALLLALTLLPMSLPLLRNLVR